MIRILGTCPGFKNHLLSYIHKHTPEHTFSLLQANHLHWSLLWCDLQLIRCYLLWTRDQWLINENKNTRLSLSIWTDIFFSLNFSAIDSETARRHHKSITVVNLKQDKSWKENKVEVVIDTILRYTDMINPKWFFFSQRGWCLLRRMTVEIIVLRL